MPLRPVPQHWSGEFDRILDSLLAQGQIEQVMPGTQEYGRVIGCSDDQRNIELEVNRGGTKKLITVDARNVIPILQSNQNDPNFLEN